MTWNDFLKPDGPARLARLTKQEAVEYSKRLEREVRKRIKSAKANQRDLQVFKEARANKALFTKPQTLQQAQHKIKLATEFLKNKLTTRSGYDDWVRENRNSYRQATGEDIPESKVWAWDEIQLMVSHQAAPYGFDSEQINIITSRVYIETRNLRNYKTIEVMPGVYRKVIDEEASAKQVFDLVEKYVEQAVASGWGNGTPYNPPKDKGVRFR